MFLSHFVANRIEKIVSRETTPKFDLERAQVEYAIKSEKLKGVDIYFELIQTIEICKNGLNLTATLLAIEILKNFMEGEIK
mgnify:CR=1 FL=1